MASSLTTTLLLLILTPNTQATKKKSFLRVAAHRPRNFYRLVAKHDSATFFICRATLLY